jgi:bifunctional non-homologous end joining protein LigD
MRAADPIQLSHPHKVMYPSIGFTKLDVARYYAAVGPAVLPHLKGRPITLKRYPDGVNGMFFYERHCPSHRPAWVDTAAVSSSSEKESVHHCVVNDLETLMWVVNLASIELHTLLSTQTNEQKPTQIIFDLDPGAPANLVQCAEVALELKKLMDALALKCFFKTSGGKGIHVSIPLNTPATFEETKPFAHSIALWLEKKWPRLVVSKMAKALRGGKVLVDWSQNDHHKSTVAPYSLRARERPTVSAPVTIDEIVRFLKKKDVKLLTFEAKDFPARLRKEGDLFAPVLKIKQKLPRKPSPKGTV